MTGVAEIPVGNGVRLVADVVLPDGAGRGGPFPAVLIRTPYDRRAHRAELRAWARRGFAAVAQDVRGRHGSGGAWHPYRHEAADGAATLAWARAQEWSDGRVVAVGASYAAHCALAMVGAGEWERLGERPPDAVIAAVPALGPAETARELTGPERLFARAGWWAAHGDRTDSDEAALAKALARDPGLLEHLPVRDLPEPLGRELPSWAEVWERRERWTAPADPVGSAACACACACASVPLLAVGGAHDPFAEDTLRLWREWPGPARLLYGPWGHGLTADPGTAAGAAHRLRLGEAQAAWARAALDGRLGGRSRGGAVALGGSELWLPAQEFLGHEPYAAGEARTAYGLGRMRLLRGPAFRADPDRPVRSDTLDVPSEGPADRCLLVGPPLPRPLDLYGPAELRLRATSDTAHADWAVRLIALTTHDVAEPLATGVVRIGEATGTGAAQSDASGSAPRPTEVTVPLGHLARRLPAGTRLRLEVAGHHFPAHARHPHTGEDPLGATRLLPSERGVDLARSALLLPVVAPRHVTHAVRPLQEICR